MYKTRLWLEINLKYINFFTGNSIKLFNFLNSDSLRDFILSFNSDSAVTFSFILTQSPNCDSEP